MLLSFEVFLEDALWSGRSDPKLAFQGIRTEIRMSLIRTRNFFHQIFFGYQSTTYCKRSELDLTAILYRGYIRSIGRRSPYRGADYLACLCLFHLIF